MPRTNLLVVLGLVASIAYLAISMRSGFIGHDEGTLGQAAERVLAGETPHIDFDEPYTGALSYLHAATFRLLGARSSSLRVVLLFFSIAFVVAYFSCASRIVSPLTALPIVFAAVAWSLKNYFTGLPSWYNLFFATFGTLALLIDTGRRQHRQTSVAPLFIAGLMGGASILFKISGVFFVLAGLLYLLYDAHVTVTEEEMTEKEMTKKGMAEGSVDRRIRRVWPWLADIAAWLAPPTTVIFLLFFMKHRLEAMDVLHFLLPGSLIASVPWLLMRRRSATTTPLANGPFLRRAMIFICGVALPLLLFLAFFILLHGMPAASALYRGILVVPQLRFGFANRPLPPLESILIAIPAFLFFLPSVQERMRGRFAVAALVAGLSAVLALAAFFPPIYSSVWSVLRPLTPFFVLLATTQLLCRDPSSEPGRRLFLLAAVVAFTSLIQYPFAFGIYFFYAAPLILLLAVEIASHHPKGRPVQLCLLSFFMIFAVLLLNTADSREHGVIYEPRNAQAVIAPNRINLLVPRIIKQGYELTANAVLTHAKGRDDLWAGPDLPEIYFLTRKRNPTRNFYDFFDPDSEANLLRLTAGPKIQVLVINRRPEFSPPLTAPALALLAQRFPNALDLGPFLVRWRAEKPPLRQQSSAESNIMREAPGR